MTRISLLLLTAVFTFSCMDTHTDSYKKELAKLNSLTKEPSIAMKGQITTFLTFQNNDAEEAMNLYVSLFENSKVTDIQRYGKEGPAKEGSIFFARFELNGSQFACSDSYIKHEWDFTPGVSNWVDCQSEEEQQKLFSALSENGKVMMPLDNYGFSQRFAFVEDRFGVSWQLNLE